MLSTRVAASTIRARRSKPIVERNRGEKSKRSMTISSIEQHGLRRPPDRPGASPCRAAPTLATAPPSDSRRSARVKAHFGTLLPRVLIALQSYGPISCTMSRMARRRVTRSPQTRSKSATSGAILSGAVAASAASTEFELVKRDMHAGIAAAPAAPGAARREGAQGPGQVVGFVPLVEALAFAGGHFGPHRDIGPRHRAKPS